MLRRCMARCAAAAGEPVLHCVSGKKVLTGVVVHPNVLTQREEDVLADEVGDWSATRHAREWGNYRHPQRQSLRNTVDFFGRHTHAGKAVVRALDGAMTLSTVAVQHAPQAVRAGLKLRVDKLVPAAPDAFRFQEYPLAEGGMLPHRDAKWQGSWFAVLSLLSDGVLSFTHVASDSRVDVLLPRRSVAVVSGAAVTEWQHGVPFEPVVSLGVAGRAVKKDYRLSVVYYKMQMDAVDVTDDVGVAVTAA